MSKIPAAVRATFAAAALALPCATWAAYTATPFNIAGSSITTLWDITNDGTIVGNADLGAFVYSGGTASYLPAYNGMAPSALGISDAGVVVGGLTSADGSSETGFFYQGGSYSTLTVSGASFTEVRHISADGRYAAGYYSGDLIQGGFVLDRATSALTLVPVDPDNNFMILQGANSSGLVTGSITGAPPRGGVLYDVASGTTTIYPTVAGSSSPRFRDITESGLIAGFAGAVSIVGTIAGGFQTFAVAGAVNTFAEGINEAGVVVGNYNGADGQAHGFIATSVPEPASALLLAAGLGLFALRRRR